MKTVLITGATRGIGLALAQKFLREGNKVIGTSLDGKLDYSNPNLLAVSLDLSSPKSIEDAAAQVSNIGKIDIIINNAGVLLDEEETCLKIDLLRKTLEVNLIGTIDFTEQLLGALNENAHIVNISSMAGSLADTDGNTTSHYPYHYPAYRISKCALNMYTRTLAMRFVHERKPFRVSSVHPGWVKTHIGGDEAPLTPEDAANDIFDLSMKDLESGMFWYKGNKIPW